MARIRSARKNDAPFSTPNRNTSAFPASLRMSDPSLSMRRAICFSLNAFLTFLLLNRNLVEIAAVVGDFERFRNFHSGHADNFSAPDEQRNSVAGFNRDFTINQKILQLFLMRHAQWLKSIACSSIADREDWFRSFRKFEVP